MKTPYESSREFYFSGNTGFGSLDRHIAARDAEWEAKVREVEKERDALEALLGMERQRRKEAEAVNNQLRRDLDAARALLKLARKELCKAGSTPAVRLGRLQVAAQIDDHFTREPPAPPADPPVTSCEAGKDECSFECQQYGERHKADSPVPAEPVQHYSTLSVIEMPTSDNGPRDVSARLEAFEARMVKEFESRLSLETDVERLSAKVATLDAAVRERWGAYDKPTAQYPAVPPAPVAIPMLPPRRAHVYIEPEPEAAPVAEPVQHPPWGARYAVPRKDLERINAEVAAGIHSKPETAGPGQHEFVSTPYDSVCAFVIRHGDQYRIPCCRLRGDPIHKGPR